MEFPEDRRYTPDHEWLLPDGTVGITDYAQDALGDVVFVELPAVGRTVKSGEAFGVVESVKSVSDLFSPADGEVVAVNEALRDHPELVNQDPTTSPRQCGLRGRFRFPGRSRSGNCNARWRNMPAATVR
jgi:glycine cleavage system H protein